MRVLFLVFMLIFFVTAKSQSIISSGYGVSPQRTSLLNNKNFNDSVSTPKWFFNSYRAISTSISFFKGGNATIFSAPMGIQLIRRINNNWYGVADVRIAPSFINIKPSYTNGFNKNFIQNSTSLSNFDIYPAASLGVMYVNDARSFSITGSITAERNVYLPLPYYPRNVAK
ncbi:MAG: hypothetical protein ABI266_01225 [Ginsengibacter sp.]